MAEELSQLEEDVKRCGHSLSKVPQLVHPDAVNDVSLVKLVDEYYWVTKTLGSKVPSKERVGDWLRWMPDN
jgi:hypothetical protein